MGFIIDESDAIMFKNLTSFYKATNKPNVDVIGLTATAYDGKEGGLEPQALETLGYKVYRTVDEDEIDEPEIKENDVELNTVGDY